MSYASSYWTLAPWSERSETMGMRDQTQDRSDQKVGTQGNEARVQPKERIVFAENQKYSGADAQNHSCEDAGGGDALPEKPQDHAWEKLRHARVSQQQERYQGRRAVDGEVKADQA